LLTAALPIRGKMTMPQTAILLPVFVQVALTFAVLIAMGLARGRSAKVRRQGLEDLALATDKDWEPAAVQAANNYKNQFEMPVLFYAVSGIAIATRLVDPAMVVLASLFVVSRIGHAIVHIGPNIVKIRGALFLIGVVLLLAMWIVLAWRVFTAGF
jgi:hypothetical protein